MNNGALVISLDFELLWGIFDKVQWEQKKDYFENTRKVIPQILQLFEDYEISCTWATVGMLFNENWDEWNQNIPQILPNYNNPELSAYAYGKEIQSRETEAMCFAPDLIKKINNTPLQEIGTHTYSHYYCLEPGQNKDSFKADLIKNLELANKKDIELKSLVFPRNQINADYLRICEDLGILNIRSNPNVWYWQNTNKGSLLQKVFRTGDAYLGTNSKSYLYTFNDHQLTQKSSRLLRPYSNVKILNSLKIKRIISEMRTAAKNKEVYHLWWHPHNFGSNSFQNLNDLKLILENFNTLRLKYGFSSFNMTFNR